MTYTYKLHSYDIENTTFLITYLPDDETLAPLKTSILLMIADYRNILNESGVPKYASQDQVPFSEHLTFTIKHWAPIEMWKRQKMMIDGYQDILALM